MDRLSEHIVMGPGPIDSQEGGFFFVGEGQLTSTDVGRIDDAGTAEYPTSATMAVPPVVVRHVADPSLYIVIWAFVSWAVCKLIPVGMN